MISDEEYNYIFEQLAQILSANGGEDVIKAVLEQMTDLGAVSADRWFAAEEHFLQRERARHMKQRRHTLPQSALFPEEDLSPLENEPSSLEAVERQLLSDFIYPPKKKVELLLQAFEATIPGPIFVGLAGLDLLGQDNIRFEALSPTDVSFTISHHDLAAQKQYAQDAMNAIEKLRDYSAQKG